LAQNVTPESFALPPRPANWRHRENETLRREQAYPVCVISLHSVSGATLKDPDKAFTWCRQATGRLLLGGISRIFDHRIGRSCGLCRAARKHAGEKETRDGSYSSKGNCNPLGMLW